MRWAGLCLTHGSHRVALAVDVQSGRRFRDAFSGQHDNAIGGRRRSEAGRMAVCLLLQLVRTRHWAWIIYGPCIEHLDAPVSDTDLGPLSTSGGPPHAFAQPWRALELKPARMLGQILPRCQWPGLNASCSVRIPRRYRHHLINSVPGTYLR